MSLDLTQFNLDLARECEGLPARETSIVQRKIALEGLKRVINKTPVDTGRAAGNWQTSVGATPEGERFSGTPYEDGIDALQEFPPFDVVLLTNNVPYASVLEEGGFIPRDPGPSSDPRPGRKGRILVRSGFSVQAPQGMVSVTVEELKAAFE